MQPLPKSNHLTNNHKTLQSPNQVPEKKEIIRKAVVKASKILQLSQKDLSLIIGFSESKASRLCNLDSSTYIECHTKEWELAVYFLRMYRSLDSLFGGHESEYRKWLTSYNNHLHGIPKKLIQKVEGLIEVTQYLDAYRGLA